jgi:uncharacterized damage-inducible protein DinB
MTRLNSALNQIRAARNYTTDLLGNLVSDDWFRQPTEGVTHIGWQVGHLAVANYHLALVRIRGKQLQDNETIPENYFTLFGKGSTPESNAASYPTPDEICNVYDRVHDKIVDELSSLADETLDDPVESPHPMFDTKLGALVWCAQHEFLHAGQIGMLRRLFGNAPLR